LKYKSLTYSSRSLTNNKRTATIQQVTQIDIRVEYVVNIDLFQDPESDVREIEQWLEFQGEVNRLFINEYIQ
jgi:hypothetical protein